MGIFENFAKDIFVNNDVTEICYIDGWAYRCVCSSLGEGIVFADTGSENPATFTLDLELPVIPAVKVGQKVKFREEFYKISLLEVDSAYTTVKLHLIEATRGVGGK